MATMNDVVLIYFEDNPVAFARIEDIVADFKPDWYHVTLLMLQLPLQTVTWILREAYIEGETFTMGGKRMRLELVKAPPQTAIDEDDEEAKVVQKSPGNEKQSNTKDIKMRSERKQSNKKTKTKVVSLQDRMKR